MGPARMHRPMGMTLIELVVVLGILAGLASMALVGVGELGARGRHDETVRLMKDIRLAVAGDGLRPGRFISDMGRLPVVQDADGDGTVEEGEALAELWDDMGRTEGVADYTDAIGQDDGGLALPVQITTDISLPGGWSGPYVETPDALLFDGWGNDFRLADPDTSTWPILGAQSAGVTEITAIGSYGSDNAEGEEEWSEQDLIREFDADSATLTVSLLVQGGTPGPPFAWMPPQAEGDRTFSDWNDGDFITVETGDVVVGTHDAANGLHAFYRASTNGTSVDKSVLPEPSWIDGNFQESGIDWYVLPRHYVMNNTYVAVFAPHADPGTTNQAKAVLEQDRYESDDVQGATLSGLTPGIRAVVAYGYYYDDANLRAVNMWRSEVQIIELCPGSNFIRLHLNSNDDFS